MENHRTLTNNLVSQGQFSVTSGSPEIIETHISTVVLTGEYAFKFKKPVDFGFLNFSTLEARKHFCEEELRLNQRLAPDLYLDVVPVTGTLEIPVLGGDGEAIEFAVRMRQFDQSELFDRKLKENTLSAELVDRLADRIAAFHQDAAVAPSDSPFCHPASIYAPMEQNFSQLGELIDEEPKREQLARLEHWTKEAFASLTGQLEARGKNGFIRECHGDMHLGNITLIGDYVTIFDGIEFNQEFRWIDTMSEMAFITMDFTDRGRADLANQLLNRYLEQSGDYDGLTLLRFYQVYRALVRAKIAAFRLADPTLEGSERDNVLQQYQSYADLAERFIHQTSPQLLLMHGVSGSGKSTVSGMLASHLGAIRLRSDVERKRLFEDSITGSGDIEQGLYSPEISRQTYDHLLQRSAMLLSAGFTLIVDAAFLKHEQREPFQQFAAELQLPCHVIALRCNEAELRQRINHRTNDVSDATLAVLDHQLKTAQTPRSDENAIKVDTAAEIDIEKIMARLMVLS